MLLRWFECNRPFQLFEGDSGGGGGNGGASGDPAPSGEPGSTGGALGNNPEPDPSPADPDGKPGLMRKAGEPAPKPGEPGAPGEPEPNPTERPEHIPIKFWDDKKNEIRTESLAKSYAELEKELTKVKAGGKDPAPETAEAYLTDFKMPEGTIGEGEDAKSLDRIKAFDKDDPALKIFAEVCKAEDLPQKKFDNILKGFLYGMNTFMPEPYDEAAEMAALGGEDKAIALIDTNRLWLDRMVTTKTIDEKQKDFLLDMAGTATGISALNAIRMETGEKPIPVDPLLTKTGGRKTREELRSLRNDARYNSKNEQEKEEYRKWVDDQYRINEITQ